MTIFISCISRYIPYLYTYKVWRFLKDTFDFRPIRPPVPSNSALRASLCRCWVAGPRRDIVVAQSLKCTVQSAQLKPPPKLKFYAPTLPTLSPIYVWIHIKTKRKFTRTITAECTENPKEKMFVFFQLFAKKGHPPTSEIKRWTFRPKNKKVAYLL